MREALRYLHNARDLLRKSPVEEGYYTDRKYIKSALGVAYLGVLEAINEYLLSSGVAKKELPKKVEEYEKALKKYASAHNGKLSKQFDYLYEELHIAGYYRGLLHKAETVKAALKGAEEFIRKLA
ncbi:MAG TPA: DUF5618 family protein [Thermodesulfovibrionales bacterium]|nr:DUF5618 family protein [Thermodesulfovibrionales bacterium]